MEQTNTPQQPSRKKAILSLLVLLALTCVVVFIFSSHWAEISAQWLLKMKTTTQVSASSTSRERIAFLREGCWGVLVCSMGQGSFHDTACSKMCIRDRSRPLAAVRCSSSASTLWSSRPFPGT